MSDLDVIRGALDFYPVGSVITSDSIRDAIDAAQIRPSLVGPLMGHAVRLGWLRPTGRWQYSARRARKHSRISEYRVAPSTNWRK